MRHMISPDGQAARAPDLRSAEPLPAWDLSDLYPGAGQPGGRARFRARGERGARRSRDRYAGKLAGHVRARTGRGASRNTSGSRRCWAG